MALELKNLVLIRDPEEDGAGPSRMTLQDAVAIHAGITEPTDGQLDWSPVASPVLMTFTAEWVGTLPEKDRQGFVELVPALARSRASEALERQRLWAIRDWPLRTFLPDWLELGARPDDAKALRAAEPVRNAGDSERILPLVDLPVKALGFEIVELREKVGLMTWLPAGKKAREAIEASAGSAARSAMHDASYEPILGWQLDEPWDNLRHQFHDGASQAAELAWLKSGGADDLFLPTVSKLQGSARELLARLLAQG